MLVSPKNLRVLVVDSKAASRMSVVALLRDCQYQVNFVSTSKEALQVLIPAASGGPAPFDIILKEHQPPEANACRLLRSMARSHLANIPVVLMSSNDDRDVIMKCLTLGAIDYLIKPLRHNELCNLWTRVWWWRKSGEGSVDHPLLLNTHDIEFNGSSEDSKETKCDDDEEPTSKEGSAPDDGNGNGSNGNGSNEKGSNGNGNSGNNHGSNGEGNGASGNGASRVEAMQHPGDGNRNGSSGENGNSATKNVQHGRGSHDNGAFATRAERNALVNTAEGKAPPTTEPPSRSFRPYSNPDGAGRKRPATTSPGLHTEHHHHHHHLHLVVSPTDPKNKQQHIAAEQSAGQQQQQQQQEGMGGGMRSESQVSSQGLNRAAKASSHHHLREKSAGTAAGAGELAPPSSSLQQAAAAAQSAEAAAAAAAGKQPRSSGCGPGLGPPFGVCGGGGNNRQSEDTMTQLPAVHGACGASLGLSPARAMGTEGYSNASAPLQLGSSSGGGGGGGLCPAVGSNMAFRCGSVTEFGAVTMASMGHGPTSFPRPGSLGGLSLGAALQQQHVAPSPLQLQPPAGSAMTMAGAWGHQQAAAMQAAAASAAAQATAMQAVAMQGCPGPVMPVLPGIFPSAPQFGAIPPHALQQLNPQALQSLFATANLQHVHSHSQGSPLAAVEALGYQMHPLYGVQPMHFLSKAAPSWQSQGLPTLPIGLRPHTAPGISEPAVASYSGLGLSAPHATKLVKERAVMGPRGQLEGQLKSGVGSPRTTEAVDAAAGAPLLPAMMLPEKARRHRAAALAKYRQKRQNLKFAKVIRYESRKQLAQQRPRVKGQFVKHVLSEGRADESLMGRGGTGGEGGGEDEETLQEDDEGDRMQCAEEDEMLTKSGFGDQNFGEECGEYEHEHSADVEEGEGMEEDEGGGGSGTDAGDGKARQAALQCGGESEEDVDLAAVEAEEESQREEEVGDDEDDVVNSLRKLREGQPYGPLSSGGVSFKGGMAQDGIGAVAGAQGKGGCQASTPAGASALLRLEDDEEEERPRPLGHEGGAEPSPGAGESHGGGRGVQARGGHVAQQHPRRQPHQQGGGGGGSAYAGGESGGHVQPEAVGQGSSGPNGTGNTKNGSDSGSNSPDEKSGNLHHSKNGAANMSSHGSGSGDGASGQQSRGGSHEGSGHGSVAEDKAGQHGSAPGTHGRHDKR